MLNRKKYFLVYPAVFLFAVICFCILSNVWVIAMTQDKVYQSLDELPINQVGLLLGTSKRYKSGKENMYFRYRIEAAAKLYHTGKVKHLIVSGDNRTIYYNEPVDMRKALIKEGVPASAITLDYAGFRTLDSVVRCKKVFGQDNVTIISQHFHTFRALFISNSYGLNAIGYVARDVQSQSHYQITLREFFARVKAVVEVYVFGRQPKFLGSPEQITMS
jgi:SanA protein